MNENKYTLEISDREAATLIIALICGADRCTKTMLVARARAWKPSLKSLRERRNMMNELVSKINKLTDQARE